MLNQTSNQRVTPHKKLHVAMLLKTIATSNKCCNYNLQTSIRINWMWTFKHSIRAGTQKFPELLKKIYLKYLYKFETLVPFEVLPLWLDALIRVPLPLLVTLSNVFNRNAVKGPPAIPVEPLLHQQNTFLLAKNKIVVVSHPPICPTMLLVICLVPWDVGFEGQTICWHCRGSTRIAGDPWQYFRWRF